VGRFIQGFDKRRDRLIATVMYLCGLRRSEALGLRKAMLEEPVTAGVVALRIRGKGGVIREVEMSTELRDELLGYALGSKGPYVFNIGGSLFTPAPLRRHFLRTATAQGSSSTAISCGTSMPRTACGNWRHSFREFGLNSALKLLQVELGHSNIATTSNYLHLADTQEASKSWAIGKTAKWRNCERQEVPNERG